MPSDGDEVVARGDDLGDVSLLFPRERDALLDPMICTPRKSESLMIWTTPAPKVGC
jgi:hypothetical protein